MPTPVASCETVIRPMARVLIHFGTGTGRSKT